MTRSSSESPRGMPILTLVVWLVCAAVGGAGLVLHYPWPHAHNAELPPLAAEMPVVELPKEQPEAQVPVETPPAAEAPADSTPPPELPPESANLPPAPPPLAPPDAPAFTPVAAPSANIAFAVPVAGPTRVVSPNQAAATRLTGSPHGVAGGTGVVAVKNPGPGAGAPAAPVPQTLVFGQGEGRQEKPDYPREALRRHQEGSVVVRFEVDEQGAVTDAEVAVPCDYPLLNQAAVHTVKRNWSFPAGPKRLYQVAIKFVLQ